MADISQKVRAEIEVSQYKQIYANESSPLVLLCSEAQR